MAQRQGQSPAENGRLQSGAAVAERPSGLVLHLERVLHASRPIVFEACIDPKELAKWWGPAGFTSPSIEIDPRGGGSYRIAMQPPDGELFYLRGEFREVDPPNRLVYTFVWEEPTPDDQETVVTLSFGDLGRDTALVLDQGPFATEERRALHEAGWTDSLERLEASLPFTTGLTRLRESATRTLDCVKPSVTVRPPSDERGDS
jgi:uncharacterized protein YndB with AHSA1/START domain